MVFIMGCVVLSTAVLIVESLPRFHGTPVLDIIAACNNALTAIFTVELLLRFASAPSWRAVFLQVYTIIDILAVIGAYIDLVRPLPGYLTVLVITQGWQVRVPLHCSAELQ